MYQNLTALLRSAAVRKRYILTFLLENVAS